MVFMPFCSVYIHILHAYNNQSTQRIPGSIGQDTISELPVIHIIFGPVVFGVGLFCCVFHGDSTLQPHAHHYGCNKFHKLKLSIGKRTRQTECSESHQWLFHFIFILRCVLQFRFMRAFVSYELMKCQEDSRMQFPCDIVKLTQFVSAVKIQIASQRCHPMT